MFYVNRLELIQAIGEAGYTLRELSRAAGISTNTLSALINKKIQGVRLKTLNKLKNTLGNTSLRNLILYEGKEEDLLMIDKLKRVDETPKDTPKLDTPTEKALIPLKGKLSEITCTEREFATLVGISPAMSHRLKVMGVLELHGRGREGRILLQKSLKEYKAYLPPAKCQELDRRLAQNGYDVLFG